MGSASQKALDFKAAINRALSQKGPGSLHLLSPCSWPWDVFRNLGVGIVLRDIKINIFVLIKMFVLIKIYLNKPKPTILWLLFSWFSF